MSAFSKSLLLFALNWLYQVVRKPAKLFFPVSGVLSKTPAETWREYRPIFRQHSTPIITPELLAALAPQRWIMAARSCFCWSVALPSLLRSSVPTTLR